MIPSPPSSLQLFTRIYENFGNLLHDFIGFSFHPQGILSVFGNIFLTIIFLCVLYLSGQKIVRLINCDVSRSSFRHFVYVVFGYVSIGTLISLLGLFSALYPVPFFILGIMLVSLLFSKKNIITLQDIFIKLRNIVKEEFRLHKWINIGVLLFVLISFSRLVLPETGEDAVGYHTDLPSLYIKSHTMMLESREEQHVMFYPQLGEMSYVMPIFFHMKDATRYIHFAFYMLIILLMYTISRKKEYDFIKFAPLFFVTAPAVIRIASSANTDFQMIFCWLTSIFILQEEKIPSSKNIFLSAVMFGATLATKGWTLIYFPILLIYIFIKLRKHAKKIALITLFLFLATALSVPLIWYIRSYISTGDPIFPAFSRVNAFSDLQNSRIFSLPIGFNYQMFYLNNLIVLSPLFFFGLLLIIPSILPFVRSIRTKNLFLIFVLLFFEQLFVNFYLGRHLLAWYSVMILIVSWGFYSMVRFRFVRISILSIYSALLIYYSVNTIFSLPYGFGWADKNKYLTRILSRDNSSYYDFDYKFEKWIKKNDKVATYGISGFYYSPFDYVDVYSIFYKKNESFDLLKKNKITHLFLKGVTVDSFCNTLKIEGCTSKKYRLISEYDTAPRYLYQILK